jgi:5'-3' exonuclease
MGIPSYFSNIVKQYKHVIKRLAGLPQIHNLYMDTNGLIYDAVRVVGSNRGMSDDEYETKLIQCVCEKIDEYILMFRPTNKVMIAFDGVAPVAKLNQQREIAQPIRAKTGGSTFKNPQEKRAWQLIDEAGCRGKIIGDAQISEKHCNFMINRGKARAQDLIDLGNEVKRLVKEKSKIDLEWEIKILR